MLQVARGWFLRLHVGAGEGGEKGGRAGTMPLPQVYQTFGFKCSSTLAMALMSSSPQPLAQPSR